MRVRAFIGLGSNMGDRMALLGRALDGIDGLEGTDVLAVSNVVESEPWGVTRQPLFVNAVACIDTDLSPEALLAVAKGLEARLGRVSGERYGPRAIDIDILLYGEEERESAALTLPHPRLAERQFVVAPLLEVAPDIRLPGGRPIEPWKATEGRILRVLGPVRGYEDRTPPKSGILRS